MNKRDHKIYLRDKQSLEARLIRKQFEDQLDAMFKDSNLLYQIADRTRVIGCGGIGAMHKLVCKLGLDRAINENIVLLLIGIQGKARTADDGGRIQRPGPG